jgi:hypothetical protein
MPGAGYTIFVNRRCGRGKGLYNVPDKTVTRRLNSLS